MPKKAQDFLVDTTLGEKSYEIKKPDEEKIVLSIEEESTVSVSALRAALDRSRQQKKNLFSRVDDALKSLGVPKPRDKATFFRLLSIMIDAGVPLIKSLDTIALQTVNRKLKTAIFDMARDVEKGETFSESMKRHPRIFKDSYIGMIHSGEASGQLNKILKQLAIEVEKNASILRKVRGAMMYPVFIIFVMIVVISGMMIMVVPKIAEVFMESGKTLPFLTRIVIGTSSFMTDKWPLIFGALAGIAIAFVVVRRTKQGRYTTDWLLVHLPFFGILIRKSILARFSRSLGNLLSSGVPIIQGLLINARGLGNDVYRKRVELAADDISRGIPLGESLRDSPEFPPMMVQMVAIGEETAQLDTIAGKIAEYYEDEVDTTVANLSKVMEPAILVIVGVVVGAIVGAVMMPIIELSQMGGAM